MLNLKKEDKNEKRSKLPFIAKKKSWISYIIIAINMQNSFPFINYFTAFFTSSRFSLTIIRGGKCFIPFSSFGYFTLFLWKLLTPSTTISWGYSTSPSLFSQTITQHLCKFNAFSLFLRKMGKFSLTFSFSVLLTLAGQVYIYTRRLAAVGDATFPIRKMVKSGR